MLSTRRQTIDACRAGPALFVGLPGNEVDLDRLAAYLVARGFDGAIHAADATLEGVLWIHDGAPGETWFLEAGGMETILPIEPERELLRDIAASGIVTVFIGRPPAGDGVEQHPRDAPATASDDARPAADSAARIGPAAKIQPAAKVGPAAKIEPPAEQPARPIGAAVVPPAPPSQPDGTLTFEPPARLGGDTAGVGAFAFGDRALVNGAPIAAWEPPPSERGPHAEPRRDTLDASTYPWPAILTEMASRVARHRGQRLAARFLDALAHQLAEYGGEVDGERIIAPPLPEPTWRVIVEAACAPVIAVAGRAFIDRTITAAERAALTRVRDGEES